VVVAGDAHRLQQVAWNLLSNAIKSRPNRVQFNVRVSTCGSHAEIQVSDNGQGIEPDFLPYVFERFRQADSSTTRLYGGLGLGLAIVSIWWNSRWHRGSRERRQKQRREVHGEIAVNFLPLTISGQWVSRCRIQAGPSLEGVHVLLVDDDPATLEMISLALTASDARVTAVSSAREAIAAIGRSKPDILVSDIAMPNEDGYELIEKVAGARIWPHKYPSKQSR